MDDIFEHMLSLPSWSDVSSMAARNNWDLSSLVATSGLGADSLAPLQTSPKLFKAALMPLLDESVEAQSRELQEGKAQQVGDSFRLHNGQSVRDQQRLVIHTSSSSSMGSGMLANQPSLKSEQTVSGLLSLMRMPQDATTGSLALLSITPPSLGTGVASQLPSSGIRRGSTSLTVSLPVGSTGTSDASAGQTPSVGYQCALPIVPVWQQPYVGSAAPTPLSLAKPETSVSVAANITTNDASIFGKRYRGVEEQSRARKQPSNADQEAKTAIFNAYGGSQVNQTHLVRTIGQPSHQQSAGHGIPVQAFGGQGTIAQSQLALTQTGAPRPARVRARRGQATDPHSIAERNRREKIADRMKSLQEIVPNANKTDKASMLDEIIEYVKFLQLQVKVLSISRMGGAGVVAPFVADVHSEGNGTFGYGNLSISSTAVSSQDILTEKEVAHLMDKDMGSAMQFLQSKGLCLMPIALATAISTTIGKPPSGIQADKNPTEPSVLSMSVSSGPVTSSASASPASVGGTGICSGIKTKTASISNMIRDYKENAATDKYKETTQSSRSERSVANSNEDVPRPNSNY
ncbi:hypothetical protein O6H91_17G044400 [Diphasiastrum complanatum]|uniref:Uncharacterized protein n=1 Tax=Diphasiastrum complanatum TaxID=34168 RepID=A0ACC2B6F1_DIPCM|nr:hypothetical protein O6H91_17G044400 [Diphasiastrum complanatum]